MPVSLPSLNCRCCSSKSPWPTPNGDTEFRIESMSRSDIVPPSSEFVEGVLLRGNESPQFSEDTVKLLPVLIVFSALPPPSSFVGGDLRFDDIVLERKNIKTNIVIIHFRRFVTVAPSRLTQTNRRCHLTPNRTRSNNNRKFTQKS